MAPQADPFKCGGMAPLRFRAARTYLRVMAETTDTPPAKPAGTSPTPAPAAKPAPIEIGGPKGPEPTRYGDWEINGRCTDF